MSEKDTNNFSQSSSSHRLPTLSASEALLKAGSSSRTISTGLPKLDAALLKLQSPSFVDTASKGIRRGHVTEIYGPPGSGKTCFAMQLATNSLQARHHVVWVDTASPLVGPRFKEILSSHRIPISEQLPSSPPTLLTVDELLSNFKHVRAPTLPHLLSLFVHPPPRFPPVGTSLVVIDSVSSLFVASFQGSSISQGHMQDEEKRNDKVKWAANRRWGVAGELLSKIGKMAAIQDVAVVVINQTTTQVRGLPSARLIPAIIGSSWDAGIDTRIVLYRDMAPDSHITDEDAPYDFRLAGVLKVGRKVVDGSVSVADKVIPFTINSRGMQPILLKGEIPDASQPPGEALSIIEQSSKRKRNEIADSEEDDDSDDDEEKYQEKAESGWGDLDIYPSSADDED